MSGQLDALPRGQILIYILFGLLEFFLDLLFYHLKLRRYVVIDLKTTDFKPEFAGKMNFYVNAVNKIVCEERDQPTI